MIETPRLRLRPPRQEDAPAVASGMTPGVSQWMGTWPVPSTPATAEERISRSLDAMAAGRSLILVVECQGAFAGWIGGGRLGGTNRGGFGYWLAEAWHGRGLMREAAPAYVEALRDRLALAAVEATCHPANRGSAAVLAACGLRRVSGRVQHAPARGRDEYVDVWERIWPREPDG